MDIKIWIPKKEIKNIQREYIDAKNQELELNFRVPNFPTQSKIGDKCYFGWDGYLRGYHIIIEFWESNGFRCLTTGREWSEGKYIVRDGTTVQWLKKPIPTQPFRGFGYMSNNLVKPESKKQKSWRDI